MDERHLRGLEIARRFYIPRMLGLGVGFIAVAAVFYENRTHPLAWVALAAHGFLWPHLAYALARRSDNPQRVELANLVTDSALGGVWIALMGGNLLPSALLATMLGMDKLAVRGPAFLGVCAGSQIAAGLLTALVFGFEFRPHTSMTVIVACLPLLVTYPLTVGWTTFQLARRVSSQNRQLAALSRTDGLSELPTRAYWEEVVRSEFARHRRHARNACLLMLDIDHFKNVNDTHGHQCGDQVIRNFARILRDTVRTKDTLGRYGGEEFGIVLPETSIESAFIVAERIRTSVEAAVLEPKSSIRVSVSLGLAAAAADMKHYGEWIERADRALYRAKLAGRNRTVIDNPAEPVAP